MSNKNVIYKIQPRQTEIDSLLAENSEKFDHFRAVKKVFVIGSVP